ncbi:MAG: hypothetical protein CM15mP68_0200 [Pseudomonadota bacterium]|nr:MAG: hypothetical protein CM15mP68_0200 [Pseudomonadota bacterium]
MANILNRGAKVAPNEEIVTATENGVAEETHKTRIGSSLAPCTGAAASRWVIVWVRSCGRLAA